jgi:hypothetical protein
MLLATASVFRLVHAENVLGIFFSLFPHTFRYSNAELAAIWASRCCMLLSEFKLETEKSDKQSYQSTPIKHNVSSSAGADLQC